MKIHTLLYRVNIISAAIVLLFVSSKAIAQTSPLLDSLVLDTLTAYTSIEQAMKNPDKVIKLELHKMKLKQFPMEIFNFTNLQYLDLSKNNLKEIPHEIGQLKNLQYLSLAKNKLEDLPLEIGELTNLETFNASQNELDVLPTTIGNLVNLKNIDLWSNSIDKYPEEMKNLKNLQVLDLRIILIPDAEQDRLQKLLPQTKIHFSPYCHCQQ